MWMKAFTQCPANLSDCWKWFYLSARQCQNTCSMARNWLQADHVIPRWLAFWVQIHLKSTTTGPRSAVGNVSGYRCVSDCRSRGREFDPGPVPYFRGDWSWNDFYGHSPPFRWFIQEGLLSVTSESMCTNYWLTACSSLPRKKCG